MTFYDPYQRLVRPSVRPSVRPPVRPSAGRPVGGGYGGLEDKKLARRVELNSTKNEMEYYYYYYYVPLGPSVTRFGEKSPLCAKWQNLWNF